MCSQERSHVLVENYGIFQKMYTFQVRGVVFYFYVSTLILPITSAVNIRTRNQANASLISLLVVIYLFSISFDNDNLYCKVTPTPDVRILTISFAARIHKV